MRKFIVDSIENELVTLLSKENEMEQVVVARSDFQENITDGDVIEATINEKCKVDSYKILDDETTTLKKKNEELLKKILNKNKH
ncbi:hypothetical protein JCM21714_1440 [Gracilibacillus boraciitolerans JCM 21714]|uniref:DUF3006 domain-containing protein n=1 Tax=Gracilibacillus boraciitolerans JCM 21714 TaxID=1298598 RepID=W4VI16_9BACI|nr:DUF3006 family protein [Gracilibacillus boraciitolerans]GAE92438.1 hypothetical protein JCM21714_1440 [Gracilibacillus boraciitolerans JCM 21714]